MQQPQQTCYESIWSRSSCHPSYNVPIPALRFIYLFQSHFVVFQPFPSHILCLWLSLDFSQTDKLISFIHTWSFSLLSPRLDFFSPWHPSSFQLAGHRALLYENSLDLKGRSEVAWGGGGGSASPQVRLSFRILSVTVKARHQRLASHQLLIVCLLLIDTVWRPGLKFRLAYVPKSKFFLPLGSGGGGGVSELCEATGNRYRFCRFLAETGGSHSFTADMDPSYTAEDASCPSKAYFSATEYFHHWSL